MTKVEERSVEQALRDLQRYGATFIHADLVAAVEAADGHMLNIEETWPKTHRLVRRAD